MEKNDQKDTFLPESLPPDSSETGIRLISGIYRMKSQRPAAAEKLPLTEIESLFSLFRKRRGQALDILIEQLRKLCQSEKITIHGDNAITNGRFDPILESMIQENDDGSVSLFIPFNRHTIELELSEEHLRDLVNNKWESYRTLIIIAGREIEEEDQFQRLVDIAAAAIHDIRNKIVCAVANASFILEDEPCLGNGSKEALRDIQASVSSAENIATQTLALLTAERKAFHLTMKPLNIDSLINRLMSTHRNLSVHDGAQARVIEADAGHLERVLDNLIDNARKYSAGQDGPVKLEINEDDHYLIIKIIDAGTGVGGDPDKLFQHYFRGEGKTSVQGFGIGLGYCKLICQMHGGGISAKNNKNGVGSTFTVKIPLQRL